MGLGMKMTFNIKSVLKSFEIKKNKNKNINDIFRFKCYKWKNLNDIKIKEWHFSKWYYEKKMVNYILIPWGMDHLMKEYEK